MFLNATRCQSGEAAGTAVFPNHFIPHPPAPMASTTAVVEGSPVGPLQQEACRINETHAVSSAPGAAGKRTNLPINAGATHLPRSSNTVTAPSTADLAPTSADPASVSSPRAATDNADTGILDSSPCARDGGRDHLQLSDACVCTAEVISEGDGSAAAAAAQLLQEQMLLKQVDASCRSTSVESDSSTVTRVMSTSSSAETSNATRLGRSSTQESSSSGNCSSIFKHSSSRKRTTSGNCTRSNNRSKRDIGSSRSSSTCSSKLGISTTCGTVSKRGKRYVVVSKSANYRHQQRQPPEQDVYVPRRSRNNGSKGRAINYVEPKCAAGNPVYKIGFSSSFSSRSTSASSANSSLAYPVPTVYTVTRSRRPQLENIFDAHSVEQTVPGAIPSPTTLAGQRGPIIKEASVGRNIQERSAGNEAAGTTARGECTSQEDARGTTDTKRICIKGPNFALRLPSSVNAKGTIRPSATTAGSCVATSVSHPQLVKQWGDSQQNAPSQEEARPQQENVIRKESTYVNVSLHSLTDELTIISYNVQMLVDCCSLSVNWWSREQQLVQYIRKIAREKNADVVVFQECWSGTCLRLIRSLAKSEGGVAFPFQTRVLGADSGPPHYRRAWGDCYCTMGECGRDCCCKMGEEDGGSSRCVCCRPCCCCCCFAPLFGRGGSKSAKAVQQQQQQQRQEQNEETDTRWTSVRGAFSRLRRNGGVLIISKWPLVERHAYIFKNGALPDCLENKGAVLVRVDKFGRIFNVVGTHLQSGYSNNHVRLAQFRELATWLRSGMEACEQEYFSAEAVDIAATGLPSTRTMKTQDDQQAPAGGEGGGAAAAASGGASTAAAGKGAGGTGEGAGGAAAAAEGGAAAPEGAAPPAAATEAEKGGTPKRKQGLPRDLIKASEPLIICGDLNTRLHEDRDTLMEALRANCLNCRLCFQDFSQACTTYDTQLNNTCAASKRLFFSRIKQVQED